MKIQKKTLNKGEIFPCKLAQAKQIFSDTDVILNFAYNHRKFGTFARTPDAFYVKKNVNGEIISAMYMHPGRKEPILAMYVLKTKDFSQELQSEFEEVYLPQLYDFYKELRDAMFDTVTYLMMIEFYEGKFKVHRMKYS